MRFAVLLIHLALAQTPSHPLLDVPYVSQTPELCGGAAVSMVLRYWGQRDVFPQDFAGLVSQSDGGILTGTLASAVRDRGWNALVEPASAATARDRFRAELDRGRPIIALIQVAPRAYHYIVIVGSTDSEVVFHDPARAPFRVLDWAAFDRDWSAANRWMMVALPPAGFTAAKIAPEPSSPPVSTIGPTSSRGIASSPCSGLVAHAVETALAGQSEDAAQELAAAMRLCPTDAAAWRETAGLRFTQKRWSEANALATTAARLAPQDSYAWELAATSRYLMGDTMAALDAWNRIDRPRVDAVNVGGAELTRVPVVVRAAGLSPRTLLTANMFARSLRRLRDVPAVSAANIKFEPADDGKADVNISIVERPPFPRGLLGVAVLASRPVLQREVRADVAGLAGAGESAFAVWRFAPRRPRVAAGLAFPSPPWLTGVTTFSAMWEEQNYAAPVVALDSPVRQTRRRAGLQLSDWASGWLKWQAGAAIDRFDTTTYFAADVALTGRWLADRVAVTTQAGSWLPFSDGSRFSSAAARVRLRSTADAARPALTAALDFQHASLAAPLAVWPSAGTGFGTERASMLRGHQLVEDGFVSGDVIGRRVMSGTIEYSAPIRTVRAVTISLAGFVDAARASLRRRALDPTPVFVDAGAGLRVRLPGGFGGFRIDLAHRIGNGRTILSAGWLAAWPQ